MVYTIYDINEISDKQDCVKLPKELFFNPKYEKVSNMAKILYSVILYRFENGDTENGDIVYKINEIERILSCSKVSAIKYKKELLDTGLIAIEEKGKLGESDKFWIKQFEGGCKASEIQKGRLQHTDLLCYAVRFVRQSSIYRFAKRR